MNFIDLLWPKSFKEWNFFYDLHEKNLFNKKSFYELINNIKLYKENINNKKFIDKKIVGLLFTWVNIFSWIEEMYRNWSVNINWLNEKDDLNDYYNELIAEIWILFS
jgi:hypothetical protein